MFIVTAINTFIESSLKFIEIFICIQRILIDNLTSTLSLGEYKAHNLSIYVSYDRFNQFYVDVVIIGFFILLNG